MDSECFAMFIDESGTGSKSKSKTNFWVSVGVLAKIADHEPLEADLLALRKKCMRLHNKEMKGVDLSPNHFNPGITKSSVAQDLGELIRKYHLAIFVTASNMSPKLARQTKFTPSNEKTGLQAKDIARELLLERLSIMLNYKRANTDLNLLIWDLSDNNELADFSKIIGSYRNPHDGKTPNPRIIPHLLGGLSHEWAELQIADLVANYAINYLASRHYDDADTEKSQAFEQYLKPVLHNRNGKITGIGLKIMYFSNDY